MIERPDRMRFQPSRMGLTARTVYIMNPRSVIEFDISPSKHHDQYRSMYCYLYRIISSNTQASSVFDILLRVNGEGSKIPQAAGCRPATRRNPTAPHHWVGSFRFPAPPTLRTVRIRVSVVICAGWDYWECQASGTPIFW